MAKATEVGERTAHELRSAMDALHEAMDMMRQETETQRAILAHLETGLVSDSSRAAFPSSDLEGRIRKTERRISQLERYQAGLDAVDQMLMRQADERFGMERFVEMTA
jgi:hypothetical protein